MHSSDITVDMQNNRVTFHQSHAEPWKVTVVDTGLNTMTGGRIKRIQKYIGDEQFMLTYGDGVSDINIPELIAHHNKSKKLATLTAVLPSGKFGALDISKDDLITSFQEKPQGDSSWINGGFFILEPQVFEFIKDGDATIWERSPLENLAKINQLQSFKHHGFWKPMDTLREKFELEQMWNTGKAPWKVWND